jgi:hypothetical protein
MNVGAIKAIKTIKNQMKEGKKIFFIHTVKPELTATCLHRPPFERQNLKFNICYDRPLFGNQVLSLLDKLVSFLT